MMKKEKLIVKRVTYPMRFQNVSQIKHKLTEEKFQKLSENVYLTSYVKKKTKNKTYMRKQITNKWCNKCPSVCTISYIPINSRSFTDSTSINCKKKWIKWLFYSRYELGINFGLFEKLILCLENPSRGRTSH